MTKENFSDSKKFIASIPAMSFEEAMGHLESILKKLENGSETLENSISFYEIGDALRSHCETKLAQAKMRIEKIIQKPNGEITTENV